MVERGKFREDLFYRLNVLPIYLPPLRERIDDVPPLADFFVKKYAAENGRENMVIDPDTVTYLKRYSWPGNVRELQNYIERSIVLAASERLTPDLLPPHVRGEAPLRLGRLNRTDLESMCSELVSMGLAAAPEEGMAYNKVMGLVEKELIQQVLRVCQGTQTKTASRLGINRNTLHKKIEEYGLESDAR
jgi:DNA-binding NtrC family response regulator